MIDGSTENVEAAIEIRKSEFKGADLLDLMARNKISLDQGVVVQSGILDDFRSWIATRNDSNLLCSRFTVVFHNPTLGAVLNFGASIIPLSRLVSVFCSAVALKNDNGLVDYYSSVIIDFAKAMGSERVAVTSESLSYESDFMSELEAFSPDKIRLTADGDLKHLIMQDINEQVRLIYLT